MPVLTLLLDLGDLSTTGRVQALRLLARVEDALDRTAASSRHYGQAAEAAESVSPELTVSVLVEWVQSLIYPDPWQALPIATRARRRATVCGPLLRWRAQIAWVNSALLSGDPAALVEITDSDALPGLLREPDGIPAWAAATATITIAVLTERYDSDAEVFRGNLAAAALAGATDTAVGYAISHTYGLIRLGRLSDALDTLAQARTWLDVAPKWEAALHVGYAEILLLTGRLEESRGHHTRLRELAAVHQDSHAQLYVHEIAGHRALREGDLDRACDEYRQLEELDTRHRVGDAYLIVWAGHAIHTYLAAGYRGDADRVIQRLRVLSTTYPSRWPRIALDTALALRADTDGDPLRADEHYTAALAHHDHADLPLDKMQILLAYARSLRRHGQAVRARTLLREAIGIGQAGGAGWLVEHARTELGIAGGRFRAPRPPDQLTPAEQRVADQAAAGRSNREIAAHLSISETTVETHLGHVYQKKGITSRRQLFRIP